MDDRKKLPFSWISITIIEIVVFTMKKHNKTEEGGGGSKSNNATFFIA